jgi:glucarate dehydratase
VFLASGRTSRDDEGYLQRLDPSFDPALPRF